MGGNCRMIIYKCKMCGGSLAFNEGDTVGTCEYCGTKQTLPKLDDDRKANLYDRANHFRRANDFDKAMSIYEQILNEDNTDAESYWSLVLCRYGIEYVEDPVTHKRVPTVNRTQYNSVYADEDYKAAIKYADGAQTVLYQQEAKAIDEIQKGILEISQKEEPFDIFICYKETDSNGKRTHDSVLANDLYHQLTEEGFKVFFSRITLEDKLGTAYEPYIFAALNSAKVMVVLGTKLEFFNAVWVKNEWSRYLALIKNGAKKTLIPAYRDMDPYDLPEEFSHLQAQDMSKLGFMQDLIRGIRKIVKAADENVADKKDTGVYRSQSNNASLDNCLKRGSMALEDGEWEKAVEFFEQALNINPECGKAYLGQVLAGEKACTIMELFQKKYNSNNVTYTKHIMHVKEDETAQVLIRKARDMAINISEFLGVVEYQTVQEYYIAQLKDMEDYLIKNKMIKRALQFDSPDEEVFKEVEAYRQYIQGEIRKAEEKDIIAVQNAKGKIAVIIRNYKERIESELEKREEIYNQACQALQGNTEYTKRQIYNMLRGLGNYKDAPKICSNMKLEFRNRESELEDKIAVKRNELSGLGIFGGGAQKSMLKKEIDDLTQQLLNLRWEYGNIG